MCPVCGGRTELEESSIFWCDDCNIPLFEENCPSCGKRARRIGSDIRPVFPEERLLLEILIGEPFKYKESSVWNASGNHYYADGKRVNFTVGQTKTMNADVIRERLDLLRPNNDDNAFKNLLSLESSIKNSDVNCLNSFSVRLSLYSST